MTTTTFDAEMVTLLEDVLGLKITNEVAISLIGLGYTSWRDFMKITYQDCLELKKSVGKSGSLHFVQR